MLKSMLYVLDYSIRNINSSKIKNIIDKNYIPNLGSYIPQGLCIVNDYLLITLYDGDKINNSKIIILKDNTIIKTLYIDKKYHLGGICYDNLNNIIWLTTTNGSISGYKLDTLINSNDEDTILPIYNNIKLGNDFINLFNQNRIAYITYHDKNIYVGNFNTENKSIIKEFKVQDDGNIDINSEKVYPFIGYTQGITWSKDYIISSSSNGRINKSRLNILNIEDFKNKNIKKRTIYLLPPMLEGIIVKENKLFMLFEYNAIKYNNLRKIRPDIISIDLDSYKPSTNVAISK